MAETPFQEDTTAFRQWQSDVAKWLDGSVDSQTGRAVLDLLLRKTHSDFRFCMADPAKAKDERYHIEAHYKEEDRTKPWQIPVDDEFHTAFAANKIAMQLDTNAFGLFLDNDDIAVLMSPSFANETSANRKFENAETNRAMEALEYLSQLLYEYFGDDALDLCHALLHRTKKDNGTASPESSGWKVQRKKKRRAVQEAEERPLPMHGKREQLHMVLEGEWYGRLRQKYPHEEGRLAQLRTLLLERQVIRDALFQSITRLALAGERRLAASIIRKGNDELLKMEGITDAEYFYWALSNKRTLLQNAKTEGNEKEAQKLESEAAVLQAAQRDALRKQAKEALTDRIDFRQLRAKMDDARRTQQPKIIALQQRVTADTIFQEIIRHCPYVIFANSSKAPQKNIVAPTDIRRARYGNCFGGTWLLSALLQEAGLRYEELYFIKANQDYGNVVGNHAALLLATAEKELYLYDSGHDVGGRLFPLSYYGPEKERQRARTVLSQERTHPAQLDLRPDRQGLLALPKHVQLMPLREGINSCYLLHLGITSHEKKNLAVAKRFLELAASYNPADPDILYRQGILHWEQGDIAAAEHCFEAALRAFSEHPHVQFALGELAAGRNEPEEARTYFEKLAKAKYEVWDSPKFQDDAKKRSKEARRQQRRMERQKTWWGRALTRVEDYAKLVISGLRNLVPRD